jgi:hypothetical protein
VWSLVVRAQQGEPIRRIGVLSGIAEGDLEGQANLAEFFQVLQQLGWSDGRNVRFDLRWGAGDADRIRKYAAELIKPLPDVILAIGPDSVAALLEATRSVPIVFAIVPDPVGAGFVDSLAVAKDFMATISGGDMSALPPIHLWRKQPGGDPILVAGRNRLEVHKRCDCEVICAGPVDRIDENLNRRELSPALRQLLTKQRKALYEEEHRNGALRAEPAKSQNATEQTPAFIDVHAKQTGRRRATIAREISEAAKIGDDVMKKVVGTSLNGLT